MKKMYLLLVAMCCLVTHAWASNVITYKANQKLAEVTGDLDYGLHTNAFNVAITSHTFANGTGTITFAGEVTTIGKYAFYRSSDLTAITIPNSVTTIKNDAFQTSGITDLTIPASVTSIDEYSFRRSSKLTAIRVEEGNPNYDSRNNCNALIKTATNTLLQGCVNTVIPNTITVIGSYSFSDFANLKSIVIPTGVKEIAMNAFDDCGLTEITLPGSLEKIGGQAFFGCELTKITCLATTPPACVGGSYPSFQYVDKSIPVYVPGGSIKAYQSAKEWKEFTNIQASPVDHVLSYTYNSTYSENIGTSGGSFRFAVRYDAADLVKYDGKKVSKVLFYNSSASHGAEFVMKLYAGGETMKQATLVYTSETLTIPTDKEGWSKIDLSQPYVINSTNTLWQVFESSDGTAHPIPCTKTIPNNHCSYVCLDMESDDKWDIIQNYGFNFAWMIGLVLEGSGETYPLTVEGEQVGEWNYLSLAGGNASYNPSTKTLTLNGVNSTYTGNFIESDVDDLTIELAGENEGNQIAGSIVLNKNTSIAGAGGQSLQINCAGDGILFQRGLLFKAMGARVLINAGGTGLKGTGTGYCELNGVVRVQGGTAAADGAIFDKAKDGKGNPFGSLQNGAKFNNDNACIDDASGAIAKSFDFLPNQWNIYFLDGQKAVTSTNMNDILGDGTLSYNPYTNTLTMNNCSITGVDEALTAYQNFNLHLIGKNTLSGSEYGIDVDDHSVWIDGPGSLYAQGMHNAGMYGVGPLKVSDGAEVNAIGGYTGIVLLGEKMAVDNAYVYASGDDVAISGLKEEIRLNNASITNFYNSFDSYEGTYLDFWSAPCTEMEIVEGSIYKIAIDGWYLSSRNNLSDILEDGSMAYDPDNKKLTINNLTLYASNLWPIRMAIPNATLNVVGENYLYAPVKLTEALRIFWNATISGTGTLHSNVFIYDYLIITDRVTVEDDEWGIDGYSSYTLTVDNATVRMTNTHGEAAIRGVKDVVLKNAHYTTEGAVYNTETRQLEDGNGNILTSIEIVPDGTDLDNISASARPTKLFRNGNLIIERNGVKYTATGQKVR